MSSDTNYLPTRTDKHLNTLQELTEESGAVHIIDAYFINGMYEKRIIKQLDLTFPEVSAVSQLYYTLITRQGR